MEDRDRALAALFRGVNHATAKGTHWSAPLGPLDRAAKRRGTSALSAPQQTCSVHLDSAGINADYYGATLYLKTVLQHTQRIKP